MPAHRWVAGAAVLAATAAGPGLTVAGGPAGTLVLRPGTTTTGVYDVSDTGTTPLSVQVLVTGLATQGAEPEFQGAPSPGLSVTVSPSSAALRPGASVQVQVTVAVGPRAEPGGLFAGLVFRGAAPAGPGTVRVVGEIGRPLLVRVPGAVRDSGVIAGFTATRPASPAGPVRLALRFTDTGNVSYPIGGVVTLTEPGAAGGRLGVPAATVLPGDTRKVALSWPGPAAAGLLTARLALRWGLTGEHHGGAVARVLLPGGLGSPAAAAAAAHPRAGGATAVDWVVKVLAGLLVLLLLLLLLLLARRRRRASHPPATVTAVPVPSTTVSANGRPGDRFTAGP